VRFSFGPEEKVVVEGMQRIREMVRATGKPAPS
jgi:hypothetical protein